MRNILNGPHLVFGLVIIFTIHSKRILAQTPAYNKPDYPKIIPPSPEASALGKFGEFPVSLATGIPSISIPIVDYRNGEHSIPISLDYNAGGIRVEEIATNVGLGWSLNAGGVITRSVAGLPDPYNLHSPPDEVNFNPNISPVVTNFSSYNPGPDYYFARDAVLNNYDLEKDIFYYNVGGISGKFVLGNLNNIFLIPSNPTVKITWVNYGDFIITDDKGVKYTLTPGETTQFENHCSIGTSPPRENSNIYTSSWYLTKIEFPSGRRIDFSYESYVYQVKRGYDEAVYFRISTLGEDLTGLNRSCLRQETISGRRIKTISSPDNNSSVQFNYKAEARLDLNNGEQYAGNALESIQLKSAGQIIRV